MPELESGGSSPSAETAERSWDMAESGAEAAGRVRVWQTPTCRSGSPPQPFMERWQHRHRRCGHRATDEFYSSSGYR